MRTTTNKTLRKSFFNMVEIILAVGVVAIGIGSLMVLFPVGLNATNSAVADNSINNLADQFLSYLEAKIRAEKKDDWADPAQNSLVSKIRSWPRNTSCPNALEFPSAADAEDDAKWDKITLSGSTGSATLPFFMRKNNPGLYKIEQRSTYHDGSETKETVDFSTLVRIWKEPIRIDATNDVPEKYGVVLCVEFAYPAAKAASERENRLYKLELFNQDAVK